LAKRKDKHNKGYGGMAETTLVGNVLVELTATISAEWDTDHYDFTITGDQDGIVGITAEFMCDYKGELLLEDRIVKLDDQIELDVIGNDLLGSGCVVCRIASVA
jgi:hypothetical protein